MLSLTRCAYGARSTPARPTPAVHTVRADCRAAQGCVPRLPTAKATSQRLGADWRRRGPDGVGVGVGGHGRVTRCLRRRGGGCCYAGAEADTSAFTNSISALSSEQLAERVVWLPPMRRSNASASVMPDFDAATAETASANNMRTMPFFALGKEPYLPGSEQVGLERMTSSGPPHPHTPAAMPQTRINPTRALESPHRAPQTRLSNDTSVHPPTPALPPTTLTTTAPRREQWVLEKATPPKAATRVSGVVASTMAQVLNIFEPRYREMYNDILFNGSRQFVVRGWHTSFKRLGFGRFGRFVAVGLLRL